MALKNYQIIEIPITFSPRGYAEGKKIKPIDAIKATLVVIKIKFSL